MPPSNINRSLGRNWSVSESEVNRGSTVLSEPVTSPDQSVFHVAFDPGANPVGPLAASLVQHAADAEGVVHDGLTRPFEAVFQYALGEQGTALPLDGLRQIMFEPEPLQYPIGETAPTVLLLKRITLAVV